MIHSVNTVKPRYYGHHRDQKRCPYYGLSLLSGLIFKENIWVGTKKTVLNNECP